jgi:hypothetical protein
MTTYQVFFDIPGSRAIHPIEAKTPEQALMLARRFATGDGYWKLEFEPNDYPARVERIQVVSALAIPLAKWQHDDLLLRLASPDLLDALEAQTTAAQAVIDSWAEGDLAAAVRELDASIPDARAAIAKTKPTRA